VPAQAVKKARRLLRIELKDHLARVFTATFGQSSSKGLSGREDDTTGQSFGEMGERYRRHLGTLFPPRSCQEFSANGGEDSSGDEGEEDDEGEGEQEQEQARVHGQTGNADMLGADGGVHSDACPMGLFYYFNSPCTADVCNCSELVDRGFLHLIVVAPVCGQSLRVFFWWRGSAHRGAS